MIDQAPGNEAIAHSVEDSFRGRAIVTKVKYGYRKLSDEDAASGQFGVVGLKITKDNNCTAILHEIRQRLLQKWRSHEPFEKRPRPKVLGRIGTNRNLLIVQVGGDFIQRILLQQSLTNLVEDRRAVRRAASLSLPSAGVGC